MTKLDELQAHEDSLKSYHHTITEAFRGLYSDVDTALVTARHNITLMNALRITQLEHGALINGLVADVSGLKTDVSGLKTDVAGLKTDVAGLKTDVAELKSDMSSVKSGLEEVLRRLQN